MTSRHNNACADRLFSKIIIKNSRLNLLHHMAADSKGNLYVTEVTPLKPENRRVQKFVLVK